MIATTAIMTPNTIETPTWGVKQQQVNGEEHIVREQARTTRYDNTFCDPPRTWLKVRDSAHVQASVG